MGERNASGIPNASRPEIGDGGGSKRRIRGESVEKKVVQKRRQERGGAELVAEMEGERTLQRGVREDSRVEIAS
ncbi:hypothetical protein V6N13_031149 [Hibiscus sabdariffa]